MKKISSALAHTKYVGWLLWRMAEACRWAYELRADTSRFRVFFRIRIALNRHGHSAVLSHLGDDAASLAGGSVATLKSPMKSPHKPYFPMSPHLPKHRSAQFEYVRLYPLPVCVWLWLWLLWLWLCASTLLTVVRRRRA